jgi:hypothetical protein
MPVLRTRLEAAKDAIGAYFDARTNDVYGLADLAAILKDRRRAWDQHDRRRIP